jgi:hypothetical protein
MTRVSLAHSIVYQVLDQVLAAESVTPGARGAMYSAIDQLRTDGGEVRYLRCAEQVSVEMHKLDCALQRQDKKASNRALAELKMLAGNWLTARICSQNAFTTA